LVEDQTERGKASNKFQIGRPKAKRKDNETEMNLDKGEERWRKWTRRMRNSVPVKV
jgi:hypothetical protein